MWCTPGIPVLARRGHKDDKFRLQGATASSCAQRGTSPEPGGASVSLAKPVKAAQPCLGLSLSESFATVDSMGIRQLPSPRPNTSAHLCFSPDAFVQLTARQLASTLPSSEPSGATPFAGPFCLHRSFFLQVMGFRAGWFCPLRKARQMPELMGRKVNGKEYHSSPLPQRDTKEGKLTRLSKPHNVNESEWLQRTEPL